jgi:hypothetical protein
VQLLAAWQAGCDERGRGHELVGEDLAHEQLRLP